MSPFLSGQWRVGRLLHICPCPPAPFPWALGRAQVSTPVFLLRVTLALEPPAQGRHFLAKGQRHP
jgi:hypothetical protein